ncbi:MAG TPA: UvrD-helicase domain-containing protein, partial [Anaerolineae bacterium]|nr:UvrD-helicase domain-containing protein [Anaerolineae bacterium]
MHDIASILDEQQRRVIEGPVESKVFLKGPAGSGKTTVGVQRMLYLLDSGVPAEAILVVVPQRTLATPYYDALHSPELGPGGQVTVVTMGGLARRMVDLFWPLVVEAAGFGHPNRKPTFLTLETAQYYMARAVRPLLEQGYFDSLVIDRNRLYSQILDDLNKAAVVGFPHTEIGERLKEAWAGDPAEKRIYDEAQECATRFREHCIEHNLLDFSLQMEVFVHHLWTLPLCRRYLLNRYTHLLVDNVEEDTPVAHDLLRDWLPHCQSALLIYDEDAGYRRFLGADPDSARGLSELCEETIR